MAAPLDKRTELALQLRDIVHQDEHRKHLIRLCVMKLASLSQGTKEGITIGNPDLTKNGNSKTINPPASSPLNSSLNETTGSDVSQKKLNAYEIQVNNLKLQLSTKEQAWAAKVDELQAEIARMSKSGLESNGASATAKRSSSGRPKGTKKRPRLAAAGSPVSRSTTPMASFFASSPFSDIKNGRGNSFSGVGIASVASQASLKLSHTAPKPSDDVFSPNNSSAESTPKKSKSADSKSMASMDTSRAVSRTSSAAKLTELGTEETGPEVQSTGVNTTVSDPEETFQSANATFESEKEKKPKRRKIRLVSSEASKLILAQQNKGLDAEEEDLTSVKYYQDGNFEANPGSPIPASSKLSASGPPVRKKHVFKIG